MSLWSRARGLITRAPAKALVEAGRVIPDQSLWLQFQRIGGGLSPQDVSQIIRNADAGYPAQLVDLANESRQKDGHLHATLQTREMAVTGLEWDLYFPGQDPKSDAGAKQAAFVKEHLKGHRHFSSLLGHLMGGVYFGHACAETMWDIVGGALVPREFILHSQRRFGFRQQDGKLIWRDVVGGSQAGVDILGEYPDKFIVSQPRINGDAPAREGLVRVLMWLALFRNWTLADWLKLAELAWKPWRKGIYKKGASKESIEALEQILLGMTASGAAVYNEDVTVELDWPGNAGAVGRSDHAGLFAVAGGEMSKAVLGQTLTTEQGKIGSQALGNVHNEIRRDIRDADARHLAEVITYFLIEPMVRLNFGPQAPVPHLRFITEENEDKLPFAQAVQILTGSDVRMRIGADYVREQLGIPKPADSEEMLGVWVEVDTTGLDEPANDQKPADKPPKDPNEDPGSN